MNPHIEQNLIELADALANNEPAPQPIASMLADAISSRIEYGGTLDAWMGIDGGNRYVFQEQEGGWIVGDGYSQALIRKRRSGFRYIRYLLDHPHQTFHVLDVERLGASTPLLDEVAQDFEAEIYTGRMGREDVIDRKTVVTVLKHMRDVKRELEAPELLDDLERQRMTDEYEQCAAYLQSSKGLRGMRFFDDETEKARKRVQKNIRSAVREVEPHSETVAEHLRASIMTGTELSYVPERPVMWSL